MHGIVVQCLFEIDVLPRGHTVVIVYTCNTYQCCAGDKASWEHSKVKRRSDCPLQTAFQLDNLCIIDQAAAMVVKCENEAVKGWQAGGLSWQAHMLIVLRLVYQIPSVTVRISHLYTLLSLQEF